MAEVVLKISGDNTDAVRSLSQVGDKVQGVSDASRKASEEQKKGSKQVADANKGVTNSIKDMNASILQTATNLLSVTAAVAGLKSLTTSVINTRAEFQKFEAVLTNTLGSNSLAQTALKNIQEFAAKTPFGVKELTEDFVKLANTGFKPTTAEMTKLGDLASSQGKSFDMLTEALIDAQTGEFERLKEFGIRAKKEGDQVTLSFKDQKVQVDNNNESIRNAILAFGDLEGVAGGMAAISETLGGKISNLDDNFDSLFNNIGENAEGAFGAVIDELNSLLGAVNSAASRVNEVRRNLKSEGIEQGFIENLTGGAGLAAQTTVNSIKSLAEETKDFATGINQLQTAQTGLNLQYKNGIIDINTYKVEAAIVRKGIKDLSESTRAYTKELKDSGAAARQLSEAELKKLIKANEDLLKVMDELEKKAKAAETSNLIGTEKINADLEIALEVIKKFEEKLIEAGVAARGAGFKLEKEQIDQLATLRVSAEQDANEKILKLRKDFYDKAKKDQEDADKAAIDFANEQVDLNQNSLEDENKAKILLTKEGSKERLDAEIEALESERDFILQNTTLTNDQRIILEQETLQKITDLQKEFTDKQPGRLAAFLGLTDAELSKVKDLLSQIGDDLKGFVDQNFEAQNKMLDDELKINDERKKAREDNIQSLQDQLLAELELQNKGLANNVDLIKQQIAAEQDAKNQDLENEKRITEEKNKLAKQQFIIDSAVQASSLITAAANILKGFSALPVIGQILSIAAIATMFATFALAKNKAAQAIGFEKGGYTGDYGVNEVAGSVHGQEFVSTAKTTKKHRPLLEALHNEDYSHLTIKDLSPLLAGTGVTFNKEVLQEIKVDQSKYAQSKRDEPNRLLAEMEKTNKNLTKFFNHYKNKPEPPVINPDGSKTERIGNTVRHTRKK